MSIDQVQTKTPDPPAAQGKPTVWPNSMVIAGAAFLIVVTCVAYLPAMGGGFILDDDLLLLNDLVKDPSGMYRMWFTADAVDYWPVSNSTLWLEWRLWGARPLGYHVTNLVLHLCTAFLAWAVLHRLKIPGAYLAAVLFAVHPVNVESVAWISQRKTIMAMFFGLLSIFWYLKADSPGRRQHDSTDPRFLEPGAVPWYLLSLLAFVLGMLSKGSIATLPLVLLLIIWWQHGQVTQWDLARVAPFVLVALPLVLVNLWFRTHGSDVELRSASVAERLAGAGAVPWFYLYKAILPWNLIFIYPQWDIETDNLLWWLPLVASIGITALLWWQRQTWWGRALLFAWAFFWLMLLPVLGFVDVSFMKWSLVNDHYQYVSILAVTAVAAAAWNAWFSRQQESGRLAALAVAGTVICLFAILTWRQTLIYADEPTIYADTIERNPTCWMAYSNLGELLLNRDQTQEAIRRFEQALEIKPDIPETHHNFGNALVQLGRLDEAIKHYQEAARLKPEVAETNESLGRMLLRAGRPQEAVQYLEQALRLKPDYPGLQVNLGLALLHAGRFQEAIDQLQAAIQRNPDDADARNNLGVALLNRGRAREALDHFDQATRLKQDYSEAWGNLALAHAQLAEGAEATAAAQKAIDLARSQGQTGLADRVQGWLSAYQAGKVKPADLPPAPELPPQSP